MKKFYDYLLTFLTPFIKLVGKIGLPKRKITGKHYYRLRDEIDIGTVLLTKTDYELSNLINPTSIKHAAIYVGRIKDDKVCYVLEALGKGVVLTDLVTFMTKKDTLVICKPNFIRNRNNFNDAIRHVALHLLGKPYDYLFNQNSKAFYCFELCEACLNFAYPELRLKSKEIVKGKKIFNEDTFLDGSFFEVVYDSRG